tara:strand:- start:185 stop:391 length:207 start_codon:yes stop_codon:yes gene_type:complete
MIIYEYIYINYNKYLLDVNITCITYIGNIILSIPIRDVFWHEEIRKKRPRGNYISYGILNNNHKIKDE